MAEHDKGGKRDDEATRQAEAVRRPPDKITSGGPAVGDTSRIQAGSEAGDMQQGASRTISGAERTATSAVRAVGSVGEGTIGAARDVLNNAISATEDVGTNLVGGVAHLAIEVVHGVGDVGETAVHTVADLLAGVADGVKSVLSEVLPGRGRATQEAPGEETPYRSTAAQRAERPMAEEEVMRH